MIAVRQLSSGRWAAVYYVENGGYGWSNRFASEDEARAWAETQNAESAP
jgi:hypothetical protein